MADDLALSVTRLIDAPVEHVWALATGRIAEWWCPKPWTTEVVALDWRAGGRMALTMRGPAGEESPMEGVFLEVTPNARFVFTNAFKAGWEPQDPRMVGIFDLASEGGGTRYTAAARHWSVEAVEQHKAMGFEAGWSAVAGQLAALAEKKC